MRYLLLSCLLLAGCDDSVATSPSVQPAPVVAATPQPGASCTPFDANLSIDAHNAKRTEFTAKQPIAGYEFEDRDTFAWVTVNHSFVGTKFDSGDTLPPGRYHVKIWTPAGCPSRWQDFSITPNPNASNASNTPAPVATTQRTRYSDRKCTNAADFAQGSPIEVLSFHAPAGNNRVTATTYEIGHPRPGQERQVERVRIGSIGITDDVGDTETEHSTTWTTPLAVGATEVVWVSGSLHGKPSAVCVTVEEL